MAARSTNPCNYGRFPGTFLLAMIYLVAYLKLDSETIHNHFDFMIAAFDITNSQAYNKKCDLFHCRQLSLEGYIFYNGSS